MTDINMVYGHAKQTASLLRADGEVRITQSATPIPGMELYVYNSGSSWCGAQSHKTGGVKVLLQGEPVTVLPGDYTSMMWDLFDKVLTYHNGYPKLSDKFIKMHHPAFNVGFPPKRNLGHAPLRVGIKDRAIGMILGNKVSNMPCEIYSLRRDICKWFHANPSVRFDAFGIPPFPPEIGGSKVHSGMIPKEHKLEKIATYPFVIAFENTYDPFWSDGFLTERMLEALFCCTVPIYLGDTKVDEVFPQSVYVDFRDFEDHRNSENPSGFTDWSFKELNEYIRDQISSPICMKRWYDSINDWWNWENIQAYNMFTSYDQWAGLVGVEACPNTNYNPTEVPREPLPLGANSMHVNHRWSILQSVGIEQCNKSLLELRNGN